MICRNLGYVQTAQKIDREKNILMEYNKLSVLELLMKNLTKRMMHMDMMKGTGSII